MKGNTKGNKANVTPKMPKMPKMDNMEIGIRKIDNGYIIRASGTQGKGRNSKYVSHESYSPTKPSMTFGKK